MLFSKLSYDYYAIKYGDVIMKISHNFFLLQDLVILNIDFHCHIIIVV
jgi:hypothetical protein